MPVVPLSIIAFWVFVGYLIGVYRTARCVRKRLERAGLEAE